MALIPGTFTPQRSSELESQLDRNHGQAVNRVRVLVGVLPGTPAWATSRCDELVRDLDELLEGLQSDREDRTDREAVAR